MFQENEPKLNNPPKNKRVEIKHFAYYDQASAYRQLQRDSKQFSKVKTILRPDGSYDVCSYVSLEKTNKKGK